MRLLLRSSYAMLKSLLPLLALALNVLAGTTPAELKESKAAHAKADAALNTTYKDVMASLAEEEKTKLRTDQRDWIAYRDGMAKAEARQAGDNPEKPESSSIYWGMMASIAEERTTWLASFLNQKDLPAGLTGEWTDSRGGWIYLQERKDGVAFGLEAVRGTAHNLGGMAGLAKKTKEGAGHTQKVEGQDEPCVLTFILSAPGALDLKTQGAESFGGKGVYFDGSYRKVAKLKKPVRTDKAPNDPDAE